ncbi:thiamine pyrophosphate-dependent dehydrogenase E1 component subunit alpha [Patescibacteria group bacterium]|nr:MAG: thiamine pyrophosphate-dependent dehydrogenase E1 component subunit alpha [Patescibacteria group bacterium]
MAPEFLKSVLKSAARIRAVELAIAAHYGEEKMRCPTHLCLGQEITPAVFGALSRAVDVFFGTYRSHGHYLAKGGDLLRLFAELLGKREGCSSGVGGSMHIIDQSAGFHGTSAIVGATVPIAAGAALSRARRNAPGIAVSFFGDAAVEEGIVMETVNFAVLHQLPVIFVCENNRLCVTTPLELRTPNDQLFRRFESFGLVGERVEAAEPLLLAAAAERAYEACCEFRGPQFLEVTTDRWATHVGAEWSGPADSWWQDPESAAAARCPLAQLARALLSQGAVTKKELGEWAGAARVEAEAAFRAASILPDCVPDDNSAFLYATGLEATLPVGEWRPRAAGGGAEPSKLVNPF